jgi:hypothetical protein
VSSHTLIASLSLSLNLSTLFSLIQSLSSVSWTRGARPRGNLLYGQTWLETPDPVRSPKLSNHGRVQYSGGGPPGKRTYCTVPHHISVLPTSEVRTSESPGGERRGLGQIPASPSSPHPRGVLWSWSCACALGPWREDLAKFRSTVELVFCLVGARRLEGEVGDPHTWTLWRTALRAGSGSALAAGSIPVRPFFLFSP